MNKKIITLSLMTLLIEQSILSYNDGFGAGLGIGLGTGALVGLAATSGARAPRDPYYDLERARAQQELREIRAENRLRQEEERAQRRLKREEEREEREHQRKLQRKKREKDRQALRQEQENETSQVQLNNHVSVKTKKASIPEQKIKSQQSTSQKKVTQSPEDLNDEIKKLQLEIAQLKNEIDVK